MLKKKSMKMALAAITIALATVAGTVVPANASDATPIPDEIRAQYIAVFNQRGIDAATQGSLLHKIETGQLLDADSQQVAPATVTTTKTATQTITRNVYPDGSVSELIQASTPAPTTGSGGAQTYDAGVTGCGGYMSGNYGVKTNCTIFYNGISWAYTYKANYSLALSSGSQSYIASAGSPVVSYVIGGSVASKSVSITRQYAISSSSPARARMRVVINLGVGGLAGQVTNDLYLNVHSQSAWVSYS